MRDRIGTIAKVFAASVFVGIISIIVGSALGIKFPSVFAQTAYTLTAMLGGVAFCSCNE